MHEMINAKKRYLQESLLEWYTQNKRDFAWRKFSASHYTIILSEILLQRTRAENVSKHSAFFFEQFPNWEALTQASLESLENALKPMGLQKQKSKAIYNLAQELCKRGFELPESTNEAHDVGLKGMYISNAFELFVLKKQAALLDVNMSRLFGRFFDAKNGKTISFSKEMKLFAQEFTNIRKCKELNWAVLDFAAIVCKARNPRCKICPISKKCSYNNFQICEMIEEVDNAKLSIKLYSARSKKTTYEKI